VKRAIAPSVNAMVLAGLMVVGGLALSVVPGTNGRILFARCIAARGCFDPDGGGWSRITDKPLSNCGRSAVWLARFGHRTMSREETP